jgi:hypothetical protein
MMPRQEMLDELVVNARYLSDNLLSNLLTFVRSLREEQQPSQAEGIELSFAEAELLREAIRDVEQGNTIRVTLEELEALVR